MPHSTHKMLPKNLHALRALAMFPAHAIWQASPAFHKTSLHFGIYLLLRNSFAQIHDVASAQKLAAQQTLACRHAESRCAGLHLLHTEYSLGFLPKSLLWQWNLRAWQHVHLPNWLDGR